VAIVARQAMPVLMVADDPGLVRLLQQALTENA